MKKDVKQNKKINISLSGKVTAIIILFMIFCAALWTTVMFINMTRNAKDNALADEKAYMSTVESNADSVEEVCNLAKQVVSETYSIIDYIKLRQDGKDLNTVEKIDFYNNEIDSIDNMTNVNPYLYSVRLFVNADIDEKKPCFYKMDRMFNLDWADNYQENQWQLNYLDNVFPGSVNKNTYLAGVISKINDENGNLLAVLEISTKIENLFMNFNSQKEGDICCFVSDEGTIYCSDAQKKIWDKNKKHLFNHINDVRNLNTSIPDKFNGKKSIISTLDMSSVNGIFVHVIKTDNTINSYYQSQTPYILVVLLSMILFVFIVIILMKNIFKRFNTLTSEVSKIQSGEKIKLTEQGDDEISELGRQINKMIQSMEHLNKENTNRQLLVKNAEIRALQNQINAHFMYNVLETIKMMAEIKEDYEISDAVTSLGDMFRYSVKWSSGMVEINEEIKYIQNYLNLLNLRFEYEIFLSLNIPEKFNKIKIPKMSLQPLVENSVSHGIENMAEDTYIYIKVFEKDDIINIEVSDPGEGMNEEILKEINEKLQSTEGVDEQSDHGRALYNVQQRIKMYFGSQYGLQVFSQEGVYTKVLIQIPNKKEN